MRGASIWVLGVVGVALMANSANAQTGYGVNGAQQLFRFDVNSPANVTVIGPVGFLPEGIDFRPGSNQLYAIDVGPNTSQLYTINIGTGQSTAVGAGFNSTGSVNGNAYSLINNTTFGFDFNPTTLQPDNSMRIRLVGTNGTNVRLNSSTGQIVAVDGTLLFGNGNSPFIDAAAYINNIPTAGGATVLYDMDSRNDALLIQNPPNAGTVTTVGPFGVTVDASRNIHFDIFTDPLTNDATIAGDTGYAVLRRDVTASGAYLLYKVNLATGQITNGALVGPDATPFDFDGGFAVQPVPELGSWALSALGLAGLGIVRRYRRG